MSKRALPLGGKLADPGFRTERAQKANAARHSVEALVSALIRRAPELTEGTRAQLRTLLASVDGGQ